LALQKTDTWRLKKWFTVYAPKVFNEVQIGEMPASDEKSALNRTIKVPLSTLTKNPAHAYSNVFLKVSDVNGDAAHTNILRIEQSHGYIRSLVRRYRGVADSVVSTTTKEGKGVVFKIIVITRNRVAHSKTTGIRKELTEYVRAYAKENELNALINAVIEGKLQAEITARIKKIALISKVEVKKLEIR